ncbi:MAG: AMP-binding protein [Firmicutes bacterium]|nr:AMP-binding protein [Bacillota bacterium]
MKESRKIERRSRYDRYAPDFPWYEPGRPIRDLKDMITSSAELFAERPCIWVKKFKGAEYKAINYKMFKQDMDALAVKMMDMGLKGKRIAVLGVGCYEWIITYMATVCGVGVIVPIDKELDSESIQNLLRAAECDILFFSSSEVKKIDKIEGLSLAVKMELYGDRISEDESFAYEEDGKYIPWKKLVKEGHELIAAGSPLYQEYLDVEIDPEVMNMLLFTSGTTGNPKGVMLCHRNMVANCIQLAEHEEILPDDVTLSVLPMHHTYETMATVMFLYRGASIAHSEGLKYITKNMQEIRNTFFIAVPLLVETVYDKIWKTAKKQGKDKLLRKVINLNRKTKRVGMDLSGVLLKSVREQLGGRLRAVVTGASAVAPEIVRGFSDFGINIVQGYGLTETSPVVAAVPMFVDQAYKDRKAGSTGVCVKGGEFKIDEPNEDGIGEILYKGPNVMLGYYNMPEETAKTFDGEWFKTGDMGFLDPEGWLYITGRAKNIIVTPTGENIYPEEIEEVVNRNPFIKDSMIYPLKKNGVETVAVQLFPNVEEFEFEYGRVPEKEEMEDIMKGIIREINGTLPTYKIIRTVIVRDEDFVRTTTKKIKRTANI